MRKEEQAPAPPETPSASGRLPFHEGQTLGGYRLVRLIGFGSMADVWLAVQKSLKRTVALKILRPEAPDSYDLRRFEREASAAANLDHPNIVRIYEMGSFPFPEALWKRILRVGRRRPLNYIAEEYIAGLNLRQWLAARGVMPPKAVVSLLAQAAAALDAADRGGIVHRDIKPDNFLLSPRPAVKLVDFGVAKVPDIPSVEKTQAGRTLGTPLYMSPEQADGQKLDIRSDLYSLGVTAYQCLTGKPPFSASSPLSLLLAHRGAPVPPIRERARDVPEPLAALVERLLAKSPDDRPKNARALFGEVCAVAHQLGCLSAATGPEGALLEELTRLGDWGEDAAGRKLFENTKECVEATCSLQTQILNAGAASSRKLTWKRAACAAALAACLGGLLGAGAAKIKNAPDTKIERFATVEEQWVFASQIGTAAAWKSVIDYFPDQSGWGSSASRQLARSLMFEGKTRRARALFGRMARSENPADASYGRAGEAWCLAAEGRYDQAAAVISDLRRAPARPYDRLTEDVITRSCRLIRESRPALVSGLDSED
ncbi:MAG: serine/threonine protein kinase [Thermoguttaceae bacterium]|nr:serine/threonine protein kinase [Thermoguttaceae bacterium]